MKKKSKIKTTIIFTYLTGTNHSHQKTKWEPNVGLFPLG